MKTPIIKNLEKKLSRIKKPSLKYKPRKQRFEDHSRNCDFDPNTGLGHSYRWYELTKVINGKLVLNSFRYSITTAKHINKVVFLLRELGVKYIIIDAPYGLQDLEACRIELARQFAEATVELKYARKKNNWRLKGVLKKLKNARTIGLTFSNKFLKQALEQAENKREYRNEKLRHKRLSLLQMHSFSDIRKPALEVL